MPAQAGIQAGLWGWIPAFESKACGPSIRPLKRWGLPG